MLLAGCNDSMRNKNSKIQINISVKALYNDIIVIRAPFIYFIAGVILNKYDVSCKS